jgi:hypothetical protein
MPALATICDRLDKEIEVLKGLNLQLSAQEALVSSIKQQLIDTMHEMNISQFKTLTDSKTYYVQKKIVPHVTNWDAVYSYIESTNDFSLLHKRLSSTHWKELIDNHIQIEGIKPYSQFTLSIKKS